MATVAPDRRVQMPEQHRLQLAFPPPSEAELAIAVHTGALKATSSTLTQLVAIEATEVVWTGAVDEQMVRPGTGEVQGARMLLWGRLVLGSRLWEVVRPGLMTNHDVSRPLLTVYDGDRPWVILGELRSGALVAAPLNDARGNPKWWTPLVEADQLAFPGSKRSQVELAHLWSLPATLPKFGSVQAGGRQTIEQAIQRYL